MGIGRYRHLVRRAVVVFILGTAAVAGIATAGEQKPPSKSPATTDVTDLWWNRDKNGQGLQLVQTGTFVYATLYGYDEAQVPFWVSAELSMFAGSAGTFTGPLFVTTGSYFAGPYNPADFNFRQAGVMTFALTGVNTGTLVYSVDGVVVFEAMERQPLTLDDYSGNYGAAVTATRTGCFESANNGTSFELVSVNIDQRETAMTIKTLDSIGVTCTSTGAYSQAGRMGRFNGNYTCTNGDFGATAASEMNNGIRRVYARAFFASTLTGCHSQGHIAGVELN